MKVSTEKKLDLCLVGKILSNKQINRESFRAVMMRIWKTNSDIEVVQDNTFLFIFVIKEIGLESLLEGHGVLITLSLFWRKLWGLVI